MNLFDVRPKRGGNAIINRVVGAISNRVGGAISNRGWGQFFSWFNIHLAPDTKASVTMSKS